ncbi:MAG: hypothetical protein DMENIID0002_01570 [Rickettsia endosymbiont of Sergentomyia squamirostris]|uniref:F pilus assembly protein TraB n=1 Tax=Candidatus Tisiphia endosymbiont of Sergentomyia squamirostris TaxID=3113639 RepID=A0AAT9G6R8_9RICK
MGIEEDKGNIRSFIGRLKIATLASKDFRDKGVNWLKLARTKPTHLLGLGGISILFLFWFFGGQKPVISEVESMQVHDEQRPEISGVQQAVDPRAKWTSEVTNDIKVMKADIEVLLKKQSEETKEQIEILNSKIELLNQQQGGGELELEDEDMGIRVLGNPKSQSLLQTSPSLPPASPPARKKLGYIKRVGGILKKDVKDYITTGSFARAVLLTGMVVGTGTSAADTPEPIVLRLVDHAIFSKGYLTQQIKEAIAIGSCTGNISSERARCRLESVSLVNRNNQIIEKHQVEGWLIGEDGRNGIKGVVVDKSSDVARMAVLSGMLSGISQFFQNQATNGVFPISPITGQQHALKAKDSLKAGTFAGVGNALEKFADYAIKRADQMSPVIVVGSGRVVDVVFKKGFGLKLQDNSTSQGKLIKPPTGIDYLDVNEEQYYSEDSSVSQASQGFHTSRNLDADRGQTAISAMQQKFTDVEDWNNDQPLSPSKQRGY